MFEWYHEARKDQFRTFVHEGILTEDEEDRDMNDWYEPGRDVRLRELERNGPFETDPKHKYLCLLYTSPSPRDRQKSRMPSSA